MAAEQPYNASPEQSLAASQALLSRGQELMARWRDGDLPIADAIWDNLGFHVATVRLEAAGVKIPIGSDAQAYIALILACVEHARAQELLETADAV